MGRKRKEFIPIKNPIGVSLDVIPEDKQPAERTQDYNEQPRPEEVMIRQAVRYLTPIQRKVWHLYNYDRLTQDEIAIKLGKKRTTIETQIRQCEARIVRWCKSNMAAYNLIKQEVDKE